MVLGFLANYSSYHYMDVTRQFLSTLEDRYENPRKKIPSECTLHFKVENDAYTLSIAQVCEAYGFSNGSMPEFPKFNEAEIFWKVFGGGDYISGSIKATLIQNPVLSIVHKFPANTIFARYDTSQVHSDELCLFFQGLKHLVRDDNGELFHDDIGNDVNLGCIFVRELATLPNWAKKILHPDLFYSSFLVPIFKKAHVPLDIHYNDGIRDYINVTYFLKCKILKPLRDVEDVEYVYLFRGPNDKRYVFSRPNKEKTSLNSQENIAFTHQVEEYQPTREAPSSSQPQEQQPPPSQSLPDIHNLILPDIPFKPKGFREKWLHRAFKIQQKVNKFLMFRLKKNEDKIRKIFGYISSPEESFYEENFEDDGDEVEQGGDEIQEEEEAMPNPVFFPQQPINSYAGPSSSSAPMDYDIARHSLHMPPPPPPHF